MCHWVSPELTNKTTTTTTNPGLRVSETPRVSGFCFLSGFRQRFWGSFSMALNGSPIWGRVKTTPPPFSHLGVSGFGSGRSGFALNLWFGSRKWECCSLAQRAITLVDDEKPIVPVADTSGPVEKALSSQSMRLHKDLNLLPNMHKSYLHGLHGVEVCMAHIKQLQNRLHFFGTVVEESEAET